MTIRPPIDALSKIRFQAVKRGRRHSWRREARRRRELDKDNPAGRETPYGQFLQSFLGDAGVEFWKSGYGHCRALMKELEQLRQEWGERVLVLTMNVDEELQIPDELGVSSLPAPASCRN